MKSNTLSDSKYNTNRNNVFIIAEAGVNHNGDISIAKKMIYEAKKAGANAVKFQSFKAEKVISKVAKMANYQITNTGRTESQLEMIKRLELSKENHLILKNYADSLNIMFLSSPFDIESTCMLDELGIPIFKIASGEIIDHDMIRYIAKTNKHIILSTGMSTLGEIEEAIGIIESEGNKNITLLQCSSNYPPKFENVNLKVMRTLKAAFQYPVGYSDHTIGFEVAVAAVALGAEIIEKHFTLDKNMEGPDHLVSLEPNEFSKMVSSIRNVELSLGNQRKLVSEEEKETKIAARKSIVAACDLKKGSIITDEDICLKRPGIGILPKHRKFVVGRKLNKDVSTDELIFLDDLE